MKSDVQQRATDENLLMEYHKYTMRWMMGEVDERNDARNSMVKDKF